MTIIYTVLITLYIVIAIFCWIVDEMMSPLQSFLGWGKKSGWRTLLEAVGWPIMSILFILQWLATKMVAFFKWLR